MKRLSSGSVLKTIGVVLLAVLAIATGLVAVIAVAAVGLIVVIVRSARRHFRGASVPLPTPDSPRRRHPDGDVIEVTTTEVKAEQ